MVRFPVTVVATGVAKIQKSGERIEAYYSFEKSKRTLYATRKALDTCFTRHSLS